MLSELIASMAVSLLYYLLSLLAGVLVKLADGIVDEGMSPKRLAWLDSLIGFAYGLLGGFLISSSPELATVFLAMVAGVLLGGKIDRRAHQYGVAGVFLALALWGLPSPNLLVLGLLLAAASLDELASDFFALRHGLLAWLFEKRVLMELTALAVSLYLHNFAFFLAVFSFDLGYNLTEFAGGRLIGKKSLSGTHLTLDLLDCKRSRLSDASFVKRFLRETPARVGMTRVSEPVVYKAPSRESDPGGVSGFVLIAESHVSVHTFPSLREAYVDVFSCKEFDAARVEREVAKAFGAKQVRTRVFSRIVG